MKKIKRLLLAEYTKLLSLDTSGGFNDVGLACN